MTMTTMTLHLPQTNPMTTIPPKQTPLSRLQADKRRLQDLCKEQEGRLNTHFQYIQDNAGNLLLAGVSALLSTTGTPKPTKGEKVTQRPLRTQTGRQAPHIPGLPAGLTSMLKMPKALSLGVGWMPVAWEVAQPLLITWSIKRVKRMIGGIFTRKKK